MLKLVEFVVIIYGSLLSIAPKHLQLVDLFEERTSLSPDIHELISMHHWHLQLFDYANDCVYDGLRIDAAAIEEDLHKVIGFLATCLERLDPLLEVLQTCLLLISLILIFQYGEFKIFEFAW